jgi:hypothetical protein
MGKLFYIRELLINKEGGWEQALFSMNAPTQQTEKQKKDHLSLIRDE